MWLYTYRVVVRANNNIVKAENIEAPSSAKAIMSVIPSYENDVREIEVSAYKTSDRGVYKSD